MLKNRYNQENRGFTIIEVLIVIAIAGLIMGVVLVAIPQLQRNQRDSARQNVASRLSTELASYANNNDGRYPFAASGTHTLANFLSKYITGSVELKNPKTGSTYTVAKASATTNNPTADQILVYPGASCDGESVTGTLSDTARTYAVRVQLDRVTTFFCTDNN
jgi:prepilin-type N-terminal cleavage/methylation domain-containing protein